MPVKVRKVRGGYRVTDAGKITAKHTTRAKAARQARLLRGVARGWRPTGKRSAR